MMERVGVRVRLMLVWLAQPTDGIFGQPVSQAILLAMASVSVGIMVWRGWWVLVIIQSLCAFWWISQFFARWVVGRS